MEKELRFYQLKEVRAADDESGRLTGYASVFNEETELREGLFEVVRPGAFRRSIDHRGRSIDIDIKALWQHDDTNVLGRQKNGTLQLEEDERGLKVTIIPPKSAVREVEAITRGDVDQMSFGFMVKRDTVSSRGDAETLRELLEVDLFEVSAVTFPAYSGTEIITDERALELRKRAMPEEEEEDQRPAAHSIEPLRRRLQLIELNC